MGDKSPRLMFRFMGNLVDVPLSVALNIKWKYKRRIIDPYPYIHGWNLRNLPSKGGRYAATFFYYPEGRPARAAGRSWPQTSVLWSVENSKKWEMSGIYKHTHTRTYIYIYIYTRIIKIYKLNEHLSLLIYIYIYYTYISYKNIYI